MKCERKQRMENWITTLAFLTHLAVIDLRSAYFSFGLRIEYLV